MKLQEEFTSVFKIQNVVKTDPAFKYVKPEERTITLPPTAGSSEQKVIKYQHIKISEVLKLLTSDVGFQKEKSRRTPEEGLLKDVKDGRAYHDNIYFKQNPEAYTLILVSDDFEVANPLGARKGCYKINNLYWTLAEIPKHLRCVG